MRILSFSVSNFRSLTRVQKIDFSEKTVLVGKNNEGKSNLLKAINIAMNLLVGHEIRSGRRIISSRYRRRNESIYNWERDFPIEKQKQKKGLETTFRIEFNLDDAELLEFKETIKSSLNGILPIEISIGIDSRPEYKIAKIGRGQITLNEKKRKILDFISERISINYIPAIRTDDEALSVIRSMLSDELQVLEEKEEYQNALQTISDLQKPLIKHLGDTIQLSLQEFLPSVKNVRIEIEEEERRIALRTDLNVIVDDGTPTDIKFKGDGIKSLVALCLLKNMKSSGNEVILIEEPESHLHPEAIHGLVSVIERIAKNNQVVISTHNPLFVERKFIEHNIIVNSGRAISAKKIEDIRKILGIKASDNLMNASYVLIVEGESDRRSLNAILPTLSELIAGAMKNHSLVLDAIGGTGNLLYKLQTLRNSLCSFYVFFDNDEAARERITKALEEHYLENDGYTCSVCNGMNESEFEDCLEVEVYMEAIQKEFSIQLDGPAFRGNKKWSVRMKSCFQNCGKIWNEKTENLVKTIVADCIEANPHEALNQHKRSSIDALVRSLENLLLRISDI